MIHDAPYVAAYGYGCMLIVLIEITIYVQYSMFLF